MDREARLGVFLESVAASGLVYGGKAGAQDCLTMLADWYIALTGRPDPVAEFRGRYSDMETAHELLPGKAWMLRAVRDICAREGLPRTAKPTLGDIAILRDRVAGPTGAIRTAQHWALKGAEGLLLIPAFAAAGRPAPRLAMAWSL